jgi:hypothetical protein
MVSSANGTNEDIDILWSGVILKKSTVVIIIRRERGETYEVENE